MLSKAGTVFYCLCVFVRAKTEKLLIIIISITTVYSAQIQASWSHQKLM